MCPVKALANFCKRSCGLCPVDGTWSPWEQWGSCSVTCDGGVQKRTRICNSLASWMGGDDCVGYRVQSQNCANTPCPVDGQWGEWGKWSTCTKTCGGGQQLRHRSCDNPIPLHGGSNCSGKSYEAPSCSTNPCPVDGSWSNWGKWSTCTKTCGGGYHSRNRSCDNPIPSHCGSDCTGNNFQTSSCSTHLCPDDGQWSNWGKWSTCTKSCGGGQHLRSRSCDNPFPAHGGSNCTGNNSESEGCSTNQCPVDGQWGSWGKWSTCTRTCGGGQHLRNRSCDNPLPAHGGSSCTGESSDFDTCSISPCPVDGHWSNWGEWSTCTKSCGGGQQYRNRSCDNPSPALGGSKCSGNNSESEACSTNLCPVNGHWSTWEEWVKCSVTCGGGHTYRHRSCSNPAPAHGGSSCHGSNYSSSTCATSKCPPCPQSWLHYGNSCYNISRHKVSWDSAVKICESMGAWLVEINSYDENYFLKSHLNQDIDYSIGTKGDSDGRYRWIKSDRYVDWGYRDWCDKQPDHWGGENCGVFYRHCGWKWNDEICHFTRGYVCEKDALN